MATAAVGGSHLVASTQAGAKFGWQLALLILVVNVLKYPFFRAGVSYTISTKQTLQQGYASMGKRYLLLALALNCIACVVNAAALLLFAASLLSYFVPLNLAITACAAIVLALILLIIMAGHFEGLDNIAKLIMSVLVIATIAVFIVALSNYNPTQAPLDPPSPYTLATLGFLVVTMGWMPAPIEISSITSLWLKRQCVNQAVTPKSALFDFNLGYGVTALLALLFLGLGALIVYGSGETLSASGIGFSHQLISMYSTTIGSWSHWLIALVAFLCIFGSALTVYDGYARVVAEGISLLTNRNKAARNKLVTPVLLVMAVMSFTIVMFFKSALLAMLGFAMTLAFMTTPVFALLNHKLVQQTQLHPDAAPNIAIKVLSVIGLLYLFGFLFVFIWWQWFS